MERQVRITEQAIQDLDAIAGYIARDSWLRGSQFVADALNRAESLARCPERGRMVPEFSIESIHEIYLHRFRLIYRVNAEVVYVIALIHGARDLTTAWQNDGRGDPRSIT